MKGWIALFYSILYIVAAEERDLSTQIFCTTILLFSVVETCCFCLNTAPACPFIVAQNCFLEVSWP